MKSLPEKHPFNVPDRYFDELSTTVMRRIENTSSPKVSIMPKVIRYTVAASLLFLIGYFFVDVSSRNEEKYSIELFSNLSNQELATYLLSEADPFELSEWIENVPIHETESLDEWWDIELIDIEEHL